MMKTNIVSLAVAATMAITSIPAWAGEPLKADFGTDIVSTYVWRGQMLDHAAVQPTLGLEWGGLSFSAWGSTGLVSDFRELDFTLSYSIGGLTLGFTDYWCADSIAPYFDFTSETPHVVELNLSYDFGPVAVNWYTNCLGAVGCAPDGSAAYSSYLEVSAPFTLGGLDWSAAAGASPWANDYYGAEGFSVVCISLQASKDLTVGSASIPAFAQIMTNPTTKKAYFTMGLSF